MRNLKRGTKCDFYSCINRLPDGTMVWEGNTTTNHNTVDCEKYEYGDFELLEDVRSNVIKPRPLTKTRLVHRQILFLKFGVELSRRYDVFAKNGNRLDITLSNLGIRDTENGQEYEPAAFFAANDNEAIARKRFG